MDYTDLSDPTVQMEILEWEREQRILQRERELEVELRWETPPKPPKYRTEWEEWRADLNSQLYE
mgnify:FL=1